MLDVSTEGMRVRIILIHSVFPCTDVAKYCVHTEARARPPVRIHVACQAVTSCAVVIMMGAKEEE